MRLILTPKQRDVLKFENLTKANVFDQVALSLEQPLDAVITTQKSQISHLPNMSNFSGGYLIYGEKVKVIDFNNGWIKVQYGSSQNSEHTGWVPLTDIL